MNLKSLSFAAAVATGLFAPMAQALTVVPATYVTGFVTAVDAQRGAITVDGQAYAIAPAMLHDVTPGSEVTLALVDVAGKRTAIALEPMIEEINPEIVYGADE